MEMQSLRGPVVDRVLISNAFASRPELEPIIDNVYDAFTVACAAFASGSKLLVCGNEGSAADAEHIVGELAKGYKKQRSLSAAMSKKLKEISPKGGAALATKLQTGLPAISLVSQTALLTAITNDIDGSVISAQQVGAYAGNGDCLVGLSTSGVSTNVVNAFVVAKAVGATTIGFTGSNPGLLGSSSDTVIAAPSAETASVQPCHQIVYHAVCDAIETAFFPR